MMPVSNRTTKMQPKTETSDVENATADQQPQAVQTAHIEPGVFNTDELRTKRAEAERAGDTAAVAHIDALIREDEAAARMNT